MGVVDPIVGAMRAAFGLAPGLQISVQDPIGENLSAYYEMLRLHYYNNRLYDELAVRLIGEGMTTVEASQVVGLRNPTRAAVGVYVATLWPGRVQSAFPVDSSDQGVIRAAQVLFDWSNWGQRKQVYARWLPMLGDVFLKVATRPETGDPRRVFTELVEPDYVVESWSRRDERDYLTRVRVDVPRWRPVGSTRERRWDVEIWDKDAERARFWSMTDREHQESLTPANPQFPRPVRELPLANLGIDFVPFSHAKCFDDGRPRGAALIMNAIEKIHELDRMASSLHHRLYRYNQPDWIVTSNGMSGDGPYSMPDLGTLIDADQLGKAITIGGESYYALPAGWTLTSQVPNVSYESQIRAISEQYDALIKTDLPELSWYEVSEAQGDQSGRALEYKMTPAGANISEVRGNGEAALIQSMQQAFTIGAHLRLEPFTSLPAFGEESRAFTFRDRDAIPQNRRERQEADRQRAEVFRVLTDAGVPPRQAALVAGYSDEQAAMLDDMTPAGVIEQ